MPPGHALLLELGGANSSSDVLSAMGISVEVRATDAGTVANVDWEPVEPARFSGAQSGLSTRVQQRHLDACHLPAILGGNLNP